MIRNTVQVSLADRSYPITIGEGLFADGTLLEPFVRDRRCFLVADSTVAPLFSDMVRKTLEMAHAASVSCSVFPAGEESKHLATIGELCRAAAQAGLDRRSVMIALGGGVTGDMTGFAAAIYMRGIDFIQIPTTLLAMVDSSVGGKTGVDLPEGKNLVGAFHQPRAVVIDTDLLKTLPDSQFLCGLAEIVKSAAILDEAFFSELERHVEEIRKRDPQFVAEMIRRCCELKASVVSRDEREGSLRAILNYGHTCGHAIENSFQYRMLHGDAVAIGMRLAADLAVELGVMERSEAERQKALLEALRLPTSIACDPERVYQAMFKDKKALDGVLRFVFTPVTGRAEVRKVEGPLVRAVLERCRNA